MKIENELVKVPYTAIFDSSFEIEKDKHFILDTITVHGCKENCVYNKVNYEIQVVDKNMVLIPFEKTYDSYLFKAERVINAKVIDIPVDEVLSSCIRDGNHHFLLDFE